MKKTKSSGFDLTREPENNSKALLIEARAQEMESIRHGFYTVFMGVKIPSKPIKPFLGR